MHTLPEIEKYRVSFQNRWKNEEADLEKRYEKAREVANSASVLLKRIYSAKKVLSYGSINNKNKFHIGSDIDIAVLGLDETKYLEVVSKLIDIDPSIEINLVRLEETSDWLKTIIEEEGMEL
jgi:uncharacterized protein